jgi:hypothetical protein
MKMHWQTLKSPKFLIGAVVLFFLVLWLVNRSGSASTSSNTVTASGTDPNVLAANTQLALAGISAGQQNNAIAASLAAQQDQDQTAVALATIQAKLSDNANSSQAAIAALGITAQKEIALNSNELTFNTTKLAYDSANYSTAVNAGLQAHLADNQLQAFDLQTLAGHITDVRLHGGQRLAVLTQLINSASPQISGQTGQSGSVTYGVPPLPQTTWNA